MRRNWEASCREIPELASTVGDDTLPAKLEQTAEAIFNRLYGSNKPSQSCGRSPKRRRRTAGAATEESLFGAATEESLFCLPDRILGSEAETVRTVITGDFKAENLFFGWPSKGEAARDGFVAHEECAAVDFQWAGGGCGCIDVVYLLWTSLEPGLLHTDEMGFLDFYFDRLTSYGVSGFDRRDLQGQYDLALLDFARFALSDSTLIPSDVTLMARAAQLLAE